MKRIALAFACAIMPASAWAQQAYFPPPMQTAPVAPQPGAVGSVSDDAQPAPDPYADSQRKLFFSTMTLSAAKIGSGAGCGVISPGVGTQTMSDLLQYAQGQYGFTPEDDQMVHAYRAAFKFRACSIWLGDPNLVSWLRQLGQTAMDATQPNYQQMPSVPQYVPEPDPFPPVQDEIKSDDDSGN